MDLLQKCARTGLVLAEVPVKYMMLLPLKTASYLTPNILLKIIQMTMPKKDGEDSIETEKSRGAEDQAALLKFFTSTDFIHMMFNMKLNDIWKTSTEGNPALDGKVYDLDMDRWVNLLSFAKPGRPLVLNIGSCS